MCTSNTQINLKPWPDSRRGLPDCRGRLPEKYQHIRCTETSTAMTGLSLGKFRMLFSDFYVRDSPLQTETAKDMSDTAEQPQHYQKKRKV